MTSAVELFSLKDAPALIERLLPVQKLSAESYKEQMANVGKTLTALGSYWKGRKPLILAKACVLGCLLPATDNPIKDLEIFEMLMGMDEASFVIRMKRRPKPKEILGSLEIPQISDFFVSEPKGMLPCSAPVDWSDQRLIGVRVFWRNDISEIKRRNLEAQMMSKEPYRTRVDKAMRPEEVLDTIHAHIWEEVNDHLNTRAHSFRELVEQLGIMRFGHPPRIADTFCGSGQIPFEAARLGCDVYASDINPVACMLTWGALNIVGASAETRRENKKSQNDLWRYVRTAIDQLGIEADGKGWQAKAYLYCLEVKCPQSGWMVPLLTSRVVSNDVHAIAELDPDPDEKRYKIRIRDHVPIKEYEAASCGTVRRDGRGQDPYLIHTVDGVEYRTKISTLRGDGCRNDGSAGNCLRQWEKEDFKPRPDDIFQERLYCIQWIKSKSSGKGVDYEFRSVTEDDVNRERLVEGIIAEHLAEWQEKGWVPDMRIEPGNETQRLSRERGWTYWHHLFNPRQLLIASYIRRYAQATDYPGLTQVLNWSSRLSVWNRLYRGGGGNVQQTFINQALNPLFEYGCRPTSRLIGFIENDYSWFPLTSSRKVACLPANEFSDYSDIFVTDPPYGDAVNFEEILEFFIAWLRKDPPSEFADWIWDSRRSLAIKGKDEDFRRGMVAAYKRMTECMPDNGLQVIMFTHQSGSIWADMANIVWASGLQVTAAWYVVTETDSPLREGSYVKGTVLLICRKRRGVLKTSRDDLAWEIQEEVEKQVESLVGLNQEAKGLYRDENVFEDADIQMAGYAAALRVLTRYAIIDGREMEAEAIRPRVKGETTFVDSLISFAVNTANQRLVPQGIEKRFWDRLGPAERFYLTMLDQESRGAKKLDNYQNFAKAFKVREFRDLLGSEKANSARLKSAVEFGKDEMNESSELYQSVLRAVLYGMMELVKEIDGSDVLAHLTLNIPNYYGDMTQREMAAGLAGYLASRLERIRPEEASAARVLRELVKNQRLG